MSKLMRSVLDKVSEENNAYRDELRQINKQVDERITTLVGEIVTASNYTVDFSSTVSIAKELLLEPIARTIEVHAIKDLRNVENVNEQFVDKINNKLKKAKIKTQEDKNIFIENLNILLNQNYLEIVKIKRVSFLDEEGKHKDVEDCFVNFVEGVRGNSNFDMSKISNVLDNFKRELYDIITKALDNVSNLYLNNFVNEVKNALCAEIDIDITELDGSKAEERFAPYTPEMNNASVDVPVVPEVPNIDVVAPEYSQEAIEQNTNYSYDIPAVPAYEAEVAAEQNIVPEVPSYEAPAEYAQNIDYSYDIPAVPAYETEVAVEQNIVPEVPSYEAPAEYAQNADYSYDIPVVPAYETEVAAEQNIVPEVPSYEAPVEYAPSADYSYDIPVVPAVEEQAYENEVKTEYVKPMDVEEILKIAKSPVVTMPVQEEKEEVKAVENDYTLVSPLEKDFDDDSHIQAEFDEKEIVEEMIRRLQKRLEIINERQAKYDEERARVAEDEDFVNGLIKNATAKKEELDEFEAELNEKENTINEKQKELDDKLNEVLPFANALMKTEEEA